MTSLNDVRSEFLGYFEREGHRVVDSSPLVPRNDPTLLFTNSGMVQFKNIFTGVESPDFHRAATSQKCIRAGGKHNDLDNVGYTVRHHTFFEMLGNFSFGDYFKEQAIHYCWDLVTRELGVDRERLLATVYHEDEEAAELWRKCAGFGEDRIIRIPTSDNFWSMGPTGPCGPCSELFYDYGESVPGGPPGSADEDGDRFVEIWNLVFMQFETHDDGSRTELPKPSIDTGMGLERIGALLQGTNDNYATDIVRSLIEATAQETSTDPDGPGRIHHRVVADHLRSSAFLICEGVMPSKEGRGYVLRRIMRRAMRHMHMLGTKDPVMHRLVPALVKSMGAAFPELIEARELIVDTIRNEEVRFRTTLDRGLGLLESALEDLPEGADLPGETAFKLYDTYGFPLDMTQDALKERSRSVDLDGFANAMEDQRRKAREAWKGSGETAEDPVWFEILDEFGPVEFLGYESEKAEGQVLALVSDGLRTDRVGTGGDVRIVVNQTPFYSEAGGQVGDSGIIRSGDGEADILDTRRIAGVHVHVGKVVKGEILTGAAAVLEVDSSRRQKIRKNHSCTHLLHEALRSVLGGHVSQRGSLNDSNRLRFDFSHSGPMSPDDISNVEEEVNLHIEENSAVTTRLMSPDDAAALGARALFGEKYGEEVRVVSMGRAAKSGRGRNGDTYSIELCGGTHVARTGEIGLFVATGETAAAAGIRRIEGLTGNAARTYLARQDQRIADVSLALKVPPEEVAARISSLLEERTTLQRELKELRAAAASAQLSPGTQLEPKSVNGVRLVSSTLEDVPGRQLATLIDQQKSSLGSGVIVLLSASAGKTSVAVGVTEDLAQRISAVDIVREITPVLGGKGGGGRADFAQGGGPDSSRCKEAIEAARQFLERTTE